MPLTSGTLSPISLPAMSSTRCCSSKVQDATSVECALMVTADSPSADGHVAQMLAKARLVDRQVVMKRQDDGRDDAMRDVGFVTGHFAISIGDGRLARLRYYARKSAGEKRHDANLRRCCVCAGFRVPGARRRSFARDYRGANRNLTTSTR